MVLASSVKEGTSIATFPLFECPYSFVVFQLEDGYVGQLSVGDFLEQIDHSQVCRWKIKQSIKKTHETIYHLMTIYHLTVGKKTHRHASELATQDADYVTTTVLSNDEKVSWCKKFNHSLNALDNNPENFMMVPHQTFCCTMHQFLVVSDKGMTIL